MCNGQPTVRVWVCHLSTPHFTCVHRCDERRVGEGDECEDGRGRCGGLRSAVAWTDLRQWAGDALCEV